jgi:hypothetical protein
VRRVHGYNYSVVLGTVPTGGRREYRTGRGNRREGGNHRKDRGSRRGYHREDRGSRRRHHREDRENRRRHERNHRQDKGNLQMDRGSPPPDRANPRKDKGRRRPLAGTPRTAAACTSASHNCSPRWGGKRRPAGRKERNSGDRALRSWVDATGPDVADMEKSSNPVDKEGNLGSSC